MFPTDVVIVAGGAHANGAVYRGVFGGERD